MIRDSIRIFVTYQGDEAAALLQGESEWASGSCSTWVALPQPTSLGLFPLK